MNDTETVHVIDDDRDMREGVSLLLAAEGFRVCAYASALEFLGHAASATGCVVTDVRMPDMTGIELMARMKEARVSLPVIVMTAYGDVALAVQAMKDGAVDFLEKPFDDEPMLAAVQSALAHGRNAKLREAEQAAARERFSRLTGREKDVLAALIKGHLNKTIAHDLKLSVRTVETHRSNLMTKMGATSLSALVRTALLAAAPRAEATSAS